MAGVMRGDPPQALVCPITLDLMRDPVVDANGHTFQRSAIERSLELRPGKSPTTNASYSDGDARLMQIYTIHDMIDAFHEAASEATCALAHYGYQACCTRRILGDSLVCNLFGWLIFCIIKVGPIIIIP
jgi:hypothetical protein